MADTPAPTPKPILVWIKSSHADFLTRGLLPDDPDTTLFLVSKQNKGYSMLGAFIPDAEEKMLFPSLEEAQAAAEQYLLRWVCQHAPAILERCGMPEAPKTVRKFTLPLDDLPQFQSHSTRVPSS